MNQFKMTDAERERNRKYQADFKRRQEEKQELFNEAMRLAKRAMADIPTLLDAYGRTKEANRIRRAMKMMEGEEWK